MPSLDDFELRIMTREEQLRPCADRPVDITKPGWDVRLRQRQHPLDEAGIRRDAETLLGELINHYCTNGEHTREAIRKLFKEYQAFAWAVSLSFDPKTEESFRQHLLLFSMKDQGTDSRDALLLLQHLCGRAVAAGVNTGPILKEIADLSSDKNKYGMGSTKDMLLKASRK